MATAVQVLRAVPGGRLSQEAGLREAGGGVRAYLVRVGVASSRVEALWAPLSSWPWEGMTRERVTLVLLVLWALEYGTETGYTRPPAAWGGREQWAAGSG